MDAVNERSTSRAVFLAKFKNTEHALKILSAKTLLAQAQKKKKNWPDCELYNSEYAALCAQIDQLKSEAHRCLKCNVAVAPTAYSCRKCYQEIIENEENISQPAEIEKELAEIWARKNAIGIPLTEPRVVCYHRWRELRRRNVAARVNAATHRMGVCECGHAKQLSETRCTACQDARFIIRQRVRWRSSHAVKQKTQTYVPKILTKPLPDFVTRRGRRSGTAYDRAEGHTHDNNLFDNIMRAYEEFND